ncbi:MAG: RNA polymerase sigma-54 factor [Verrucomicrobiia bacterium Tous-C5FEB]|nr:MAG: RNA polymerase sigma-54 factor [Verrucomicrobiae bacterium Tous-C5FEB]
MSLSLQPSLRQTVSISPQIQQSLQLLQTPALELENLLQTELQTNPVLEEELRPAETAELPPEEEEDSHFSTRDSDWPVHTSRVDRPRLDPRQAFVESRVHPESLTDHLSSQLTLTQVEPAIQAAASEIIGNLDEDGFLRADLAEIATATHTTPAQVDQALALVQSFHPPGIAARTLPEALLLQLQSQGQEDTLKAQIVRHHFDLLGKRKFAEIATATSAPLESVQSAAEAIARLSPRPGSAFAPDRPDLVVRPEATFVQDGHRWVPQIEGDLLPRLRISDTYKDLLGHESADEHTRSYLKERIRSARFLLHSLERRQETLQKLLEVIALRQADYFSDGPSALHPLTMSEVAQTIGVHETTVGRAVANKYVRTPHGTVPLRYFFATALGGQRDAGPAVANTQAKQLLAEIVGRESAEKPYSDAALEEMLRERGIPIARRTISKYRAELGILPTHLRRRS